MTAGRFEILYEPAHPMWPGGFVQRESATPLPLSPARAQQVVLRWEEHVKETGRSDSKNLVRLRSWAPHQDGLFLDLGPTNYREFVGTRKPEDLQRFGMDGVANPIGVCCVVVTSDDRILLELRSKTDLHDRRLHVVGGLAEWDKDRGPQGIDFWSAIARECWEEVRVGLVPGSLRCTGLAYDRESPHAELCFMARCRDTWGEVDQRAKPTNEFRHMVLLEAAPAKLREFLIRRQGQFVPTGEAALLLYGRAVEPRAPWFQERVDSAVRRPPVEGG